MYNQSQSQLLQEQTRQWIAQKEHKNIEHKIEEDIEGLRNVLRFHEYRYYVLNDPLLADAEYDVLYKLLEKFELQHPCRSA